MGYTVQHRSSKRMALYIALCALYLPLGMFGQSWKFIVYGDTRSNDDKHREVLQSMAANSPGYAFILNAGDVVNNGTSTSDWEIWQEAVDDILGGSGQSSIPPRYMATPGNHDNLDQSAGLANWHAYLPGQAQQFGNEGKFFVFDYLNARFVILDSDVSSLTGAQYTMLLNAIEQNPKTWLFTVWHNPIFDFGPKSYEDEIHDTWGIPLYQNGCDIMFMGHAHYYVRTKKLGLNGDKHPPLDPDDGTVQIVAGNGAASLKTVDPDNEGNGYMVENYIKDYGYCELSINGNVLQYRHILRDGTIFDEEIYDPNPKTGSTPIAGTGGAELPRAYNLHQNYPNPFNPSTTIEFSLPVDSEVSLKVYNNLGQEVTTLVSEALAAGRHRVVWNAEDVYGNRLPSGIYMSLLRASSFTKAVKMVLLR
ncbi:MAG: metallophosphoesterase [Calditrichaceae bacterium]|nr:metallophosphoesterase [Calditrichia bacterium]NUQ42527.1 metallophosphoesterase [Calditrichaceae bacterium]